MIRVWHLLPFLSWLTSLSMGLGAAKVAGGGLRNHAIALSLGGGVGLLCGGLAWLFGRALIRRSASEDLRPVSTGAVLRQQAAVVCWMGFSGAVAAFALQLAMGS